MQFLVIARITEGISLDKVKSHIKPEVEKVWEYYSANILRSIYYIADLSGTVMMLEADSSETVREKMAQLPMVENNVLDLEILPLKAYTGLEALFAEKGDR